MSFENTTFTVQETPVEIQDVEGHCGGCYGCSGCKYFEAE